MKFGGTSVEDPAAIGRTAAIVAGRVAMGKQPVVVVSAMAKVTDQLLRAAAAASQGDRTGALAISSRLRSRHRDTACRLVKNAAEAAALVNLDRPEVRLARRNSARPGCHSRTHAAHLRPDRQLRRAHLQPHRRRGLPRARHRRRPRRRARSHRHRLAVPEGRSAGRHHRKARPGEAAPAARARARCR